MSTQNVNNEVKDKSFTEKESVNKPIQYNCDGKGWIIAGYIFSILGGWLGWLIGVVLISSKVKLEDGTKVHKYNKPTRNQGWIIFVLGVVFCLTWNIIKTLGI